MNSGSSFIIVSYTKNNLSQKSIFLNQKTSNDILYYTIIINLQKTTLKKRNYESIKGVAK